MDDVNEFVFVIGGGSNFVVVDVGWLGVVVFVCIVGIEWDGD